MFVRSAGGRGWVGPLGKSYLATQVDLPGGPFQDGRGYTPGGPFHDDGDTLQECYVTSTEMLSL